MSSDIAQIVDYSALVAARIPGVRAVFGCGAGFYDDPLRAGQALQPGPEKVVLPFTHTSDLPDAPQIEPTTQSGTFGLTWSVPMRLYVNRDRLSDVRRSLLPFYDGYLAAFARDRTLGGLAALAYLKTMSVEADDAWAWLAMDLSVQEYVAW